MQTRTHVHEEVFITSATLAVFEPPRRLVFSDYRYHARSGPLPFDADFRTEFTVAPHPDGVLPRVSQAGFPCTPEGDRFHDACVQGWRHTFAGIRGFLTSSSNGSTELVDPGPS
jgi:hypothetical protein